jgi:murein DD-endopeptidase MepM/ murein hydrolase activator NlpD
VKAGATGYGVDLRTLAPTPPPSAPALASTYTIKQGDYLSKVFGQNWQKVYNDNVDVIGSNPDLVLPGQVLKVGGLTLAKAPISIPSHTGYADPVPTGTLTQGFTLGIHNGIDIAAPIGTPIYAAASGTVTTAGLHDPAGFGAVIYVNDDDGSVTWYGHINSWDVAVGQHINVGDKIGTVGQRGNSTGPHLHFEIHIGPGPVNPANYIARYGA